VPLVLHGPGVPTSGRVGTAIRHVDIFPTVLQLAGAGDDPRASQGPGASVLPLLPGGGTDRPGYSEAVGVKMGSADQWLVSLRHDGWKLVRRAAGDAPPLLWRLPDETTDRAAAEPAVVSRLEDELDRLLAGEQLDRTGEDLTAREAAEVEEHLRGLGYID
jgi:arylsulfatase A-like enzyme